ncbi:MAG TPA: hypothetical protein VK188_01280 [Holophaga sp.]|nr:hypothetical protein [Holophaga sp.]
MNTRVPLLLGAAMAASFLTAGGVSLQNKTKRTFQFSRIEDRSLKEAHRSPRKTAWDSGFELGPGQESALDLPAPGVYRYQVFDSGTWSLLGEVKVEWDGRRTAIGLPAAPDPALGLRVEHFSAVAIAFHDAPRPLEERKDAPASSSTSTTSSNASTSAATASSSATSTSSAAPAAL